MCQMNSHCYDHLKQHSEVRKATLPQRKKKKKKGFELIFEGIGQNLAQWNGKRDSRKRERERI